MIRTTHPAPVAAPANLEAAARELRPEIALVLGSGLGPVARHFERQFACLFHEVDGLAATGIESHEGRISLGTWAKRRVVVFEGRLHYYEGHDWDQVEMPIVLAARLGVRQLVLTNAAGGIHDDLGPGSLMAIEDHIEWTRPDSWRPLRTKTSPYSPRLLEQLEEAARRASISLQRGVYATVTGPNYETPAEIRALRVQGADAVGMSTAREAVRAHQLGIEVAAISCITNRAAGLSSIPITHEEVIVNAGAQSERLACLLEACLPSL